MNPFDILRSTLEELHRQPEPEPAAKRFALSKEQINSFFETVPLPAFRRIADELKDFPLRVYIYKHARVARILVKDAKTAFNFAVAVRNPAEELQIYFSYSQNSGFGNSIAWLMYGGPINHVCETIGLSEYETLTEERLIELFVRFYLERDEIEVRIIEERRILRERAETDIEARRELRRMRRIDQRNKRGKRH